jgi:rare lipoprotein A
MKLQWWEVLAILLAWIIAQELCYADAGFATYYTTESCKREGTSGVFTANGERYNEDALTCALPHRAFGKRYEVCRAGTSSCVIVRHNDFGPGKKPRSRGVVVDLSKGAFEKLAKLSEGKIAITIKEIK